MTTLTKDAAVANDRPQGGHWLDALVQRFRSWRIRRAKSRQMGEWLPRWDAACRRCWRILSDGPATRERFERFRRNHNRLCRLIEAKTPGRGGKITLNTDSAKPSR